MNMQSFESIISGFLYNDEVAKGTASSAQIDFSKVKQGDIVLKNAFTNYDAMRDLIRKYNSDSRIMSAALTVDEALADIRDAIAHGSLDHAGNNRRAVKQLQGHGSCLFR